MVESAPLVATAPRFRTRRGWRTVRAGDDTGIAWHADGPGASARTPVVLCNGIACDDGYWRDLAEALARSRRVVRWDYRGHGRSDTPTEPDPERLGPAALVEDLAAVLDAAGVSRAVVVGHSFGVQVALEAARLLPERVAGLVAVAGAAGAPVPRRLAHALVPAGQRLTAAAPGVSSWLWHALWRGDRQYWPSRLLRGASPATPREALRGYFAHVGDADLPTLTAMFVAMQQHDATDVADTLTVPLLAIGGDADGLTPLGRMRDLALRAPDGELVVLRGGAHTLPCEQPTEILASLEPFLARLDVGYPQTRAAPTSPGRSAVAVPAPALPAGPGSPRARP